MCKLRTSYHQRNDILMVNQHFPRCPDCITKNLTSPSTVKFTQNWVLVAWNYSFLMWKNSTILKMTVEVRLDWIWSLSQVSSIWRVPRSTTGSVCVCPPRIPILLCLELEQIRDYIYYTNAPHFYSKCDLRFALAQSIAKLGFWVGTQKPFQGEPCQICFWT